MLNAALHKFSTILIRSCFLFLLLIQMPLSDQQRQKEKSSPTRFPLKMQMRKIQSCSRQLKSKLRNGDLALPMGRLDGMAAISLKLIQVGYLLQGVFSSLDPYPIKSANLINCQCQRRKDERVSATDHSQQQPPAWAAHEMADGVQ